MPGFTVYIDISVLIFSAYIFFKEEDLLKKQLALYLFSFVLFVVFSQIIFNKGYSGKQDYFYTPFDEVKKIIYIFMFFFFVFSTRIPQIPKLQLRPMRFKFGFDTILAIPILIFIVYYVSTTGVRLSGEFVDHAGERSIWVDYMYVYSIACLVAFRGSPVITILVIVITVAHLLAAERMRAFVYIVSFLIIHYNLMFKRNQSSAIFIIGFFLATFIGFIRHGAGGPSNDDYNVTHFGSVTISSLFLLDELKHFDTLQQVKFFVGTVWSNIVPSSLVPLDYNIRRYLFNSYDIPGGGWLPIWMYVMGGYLGVCLLALSLARLYKWMSSYKRNEIITPHDYSKYAMLIVFLSTVPRWFMYTPFQVIKMPIYAYVFTLLLMLFIRNFSKRN